MKYAHIYTTTLQLVNSCLSPAHLNKALASSFLSSHPGWSNDSITNANATFKVLVRRVRQGTRARSHYANSWPPSPCIHLFYQQHDHTNYISTTGLAESLAYIPQILLPGLGFQDSIFKGQKSGSGPICVGPLDINRSPGGGSSCGIAAR